MVDNVRECVQYEVLCLSEPRFLLIADCGPEEMVDSTGVKGLAEEVVR